jgi:RNA polymerase sigma-70 factor (ECF subfamily)
MNTEANIASITDEELALKVAAGSLSCFEELVCRYTPRLFHFFRPRIDTDQDVEDLVQETFFKTYRNIDRYDPEFRFSTWIYTVAVRLAVSHYRKRKRAVPAYELPAEEVTPEQLVIRRQESRNFWARAKKLSSRQYQTIWLRYAEDMSTKEIGAVLRLTPVQVRVLLHRGRSNLAKIFSLPPAIPTATEGTKVRQKVTQP